jgi:hypothetical protein
MGEMIQEPIAVETTLTQSKLTPAKMLWRGRTYQFQSCGMEYSRYEGDALLYVFYMTTREACMQIILNTKTLRWTLFEIESL